MLQPPASHAPYPPRMRDRLLRRLYRSFDREPDAVLALRIRAPGGLTWRIADTEPGDAGPGVRRLSVWRPDLPTLPFDLDGITVAQLRDALGAAGVEVPFYNEDPRVLGLGARALLPGRGDQDASDGDHLHVHRSPLLAWADAVGRWLDAAQADVAAMLRQLVVRRSGGEWSDLWASYFGLTRKAGEPDAGLNSRTEYEWRRPRSNPVAIEVNVGRLLGDEITVREPWKEMMAFSTDSRFSGSHHLPNEAEYAYHRAQARSRDWPDWTAVMAEVEADRPAGTLFLPPLNVPWPWEIDASGGRTISAGATTVGSWGVRLLDGQIWSWNFSLSNTYVLRSPQLAILEEMTGVAARPDVPFDMANRRTICVGEIVWSEQHPLDTHLQAHIAGGRERVEFGGPMVFSGGRALSDHEWRLGWKPIEKWFLEITGIATTEPFAFGAQAGVGVVEGRGVEVAAAVGDPDFGAHGTAGDAIGVYDGGWSGPWDGRVWERTGFAAPVATAGWITEAASAPVGTASGAAAASRAAAALTTGVRLAATAAGAAAARADFTPGRLFPNPAVAAASRVTASLTAQIRLAAARGATPAAAAALTDMGVAAAVSAAPIRISAALATGIPLAAAAAASATRLGAPLATAVRLGGAAQALPAVAAATLKPDLKLEAAAAAAASRVVAAVETGIPLAAQARAAATASTEGMFVPVPLEAQVAAVAARTGATLTVRTNIAAAAAGLAARVGAALTTQIRMAASRAGLASRIGAALTTQIRMAASRAGLASRIGAALGDAAVPQTFTFQHGVSGYAGGADTWIEQAAATTANGSSAFIAVDPDTANTGGTAARAQGLLRFDGVVGSGAGQVPSGSAVSAATLRVNVSNAAAGTFTLHRALRTWAAATTTWNDWTDDQGAGAGVQANDGDAVAAADAAFAPGATGTLDIDVTAAVQAWVNGQANHGWAILPPASGTDGLDLTSNEGTTAGQRPRLSVTWAAAASPRAWPETDRLFLFDPDVAASRSLDGSSRVSSLADAGGDSTRSLTQGTAASRPAIVTQFGRTFLDYDNRSGHVSLGGSSAVLDDLNDADGPSTTVIVWRPPASLPSSGHLPLWASYSANLARPGRRLTVVGGSGRLYLVRAASASQWDVDTTLPAGWTWDAAKTYVIVVRHDIGPFASTAISVNGTSFNAFTPANSGTPPWAATIGAASAALGHQQRESGVMETANGRIGAFMVFNRALSDAEIALLNTVRQSRYPGSG